jgi:hypothetical protein
LSMFGPLIAYLRGFARRREISRELEDELRFHLEHQIESNVESRRQTGGSISPCPKPSGALC